jgi:hypothetical protein
MGKLNIPGTYELLTGEQLTTHPEIYFQQHTVIPSSDNRPEINDTVGELLPSRQKIIYFRAD